MTSFDVRVWSVDARRGRKTTYRVRWVVAGRQFSDSFATKEQADRYRAELKAAARDGEGFSEETGLPESAARKHREISLYDHALEFMAAAWPTAAAKSRISLVETLARVVPILVRDLAGRPDPDTLRSALRKKLNQGPNPSELDENERKAIVWIARSSRPVRAFSDASAVCDVLDALATRLDGKPAAPEYFSRRRRVLHRVLAYAVRKHRLERNPLSKGNLPEGWTAPQAPDDAVDPGRSAVPA